MNKIESIIWYLIKYLSNSNYQDFPSQSRETDDPNFISYVLLEKDTIPIYSFNFSYQSHHIGDQGHPYDQWAQEINSYYLMNL